MDDIVRLEPYSDDWQRTANRMARSFCPSIYPCAKCSYPVISGYCCTNCGTSTPGSKSDG